MGAAQVLLVDDHAVTRRGMRGVVAEVLPEAGFTEVSTSDAFRDAAEQQQFALVLLDLALPGPPVLPQLRLLRQRGFTAPVLIVTASEELSFVVESLRAGANGVVLKGRASDELAEAVNRLIVGDGYLPPDLAVRVAQVSLDQGSLQPHERLSERELEIFRRIAVGESVKEVGNALGISPKTVSTYLSRIREKTGMTSPVEMARYALKRRLVA